MSGAVRGPAGAAPAAGLTTLCHHEGFLGGATNGSKKWFSTRAASSGKARKEMTALLFLVVLTDVAAVLSRAAS